MRRALIVIAALLALSACGGDPEPAAAPGVQATTVPTATSAADPYGKGACSLVRAAIDGETLMETGVVYAIADAAKQSTNVDVAGRAEALTEKFQHAVLAEGGDDEFLTSTELLTAAVEMHTECIRGRLD